MNASQLSIENFAGLTGVGALQILGWYLVLDGLADIYFLVEANAQSASWQIFVTVALVAFAYLLGAVSSVVGSLVVDGRAKLVTRIYDAAGRANSTASYLILEDWLKKSAILKGSILSVLVLAAGSACEAQSGNMGQWWMVGYMFVGLGIGLAVLAAITARLLDGRVLRSLEALTKG